MSKKLLFDFECNTCGYEFERLVDVDQRAVACPHCEGQSYRKIPATRGMPISAGVNPDSSMASKWDRMHEQMAKKHSED